MVEYKFSVKPFKKARRIFHTWTVAIIILSSIVIFAPWYTANGDPLYFGSITEKFFWSGSMIALVFAFPIPLYSWLAGKYEFTEKRIYHKVFFRRTVLIPWSAVYHVRKHRMGVSRSETLDIICFDLAPDLVLKKSEYSNEFYFIHQKKYFVIMYSEERMQQVQNYFRE